MGTLNPTHSLSFLVLETCASFVLLFCIFIPFVLHYGNTFIIVIVDNSHEIKARH